MRTEESYLPTLLQNRYLERNHFIEWIIAICICAIRACAICTYTYAYPTLLSTVGVTATLTLHTKRKIVTHFVIQLLSN